MVKKIESGRAVGVVRRRGVIAPTDGRASNAVIYVSVDEQEKSRYDELAKELGLSMRDLVRQGLNEVWSRHQAAKAAANIQPIERSTASSYEVASQPELITRPSVNVPLPPSVNVQVIQRQLTDYGARIAQLEHLIHSLRDPDLEQFGLRSRVAWDRDLLVELRCATMAAPVSVILIDLDNLKSVNDEHGVTVGDAVLRLVFQLVRRVIPTRGIVYRIGGDEVGVLLPSVALEKARILAEDIRSLIEREVHVGVKTLRVPQTASIGVTSFVSSTENDAALAKVDKLLYAAKQGGKNRVEFAS